MMKKQNKPIGKWNKRLLTTGLIGVVLGSGLLVPLSEVQGAPFPAEDAAKISTNATSPNVKLNVVPGANVGMVDDIKKIKIGKLTSKVTIDTQYQFNENPAEIHIGPGQLISPTGQVINVLGTEVNHQDTEVSTHFENRSTIDADRTFLMYIGSDPGRFESFGYQNKKFISAKLMRGRWWYDNNDYFINFNTNPNDFIVGEIRRASNSTTYGISSYVDLHSAGHEITRNGTSVYKGQGPIFDDKGATDVNAPTTPGAVSATYDGANSAIKFNYGASSDAGTPYSYQVTTNLILNNYPAKKLVDIHGIKVAKSVSNMGVTLDMSSAGNPNPGEVRLHSTAGSTGTIKLTNPSGTTYTFKPSTSLEHAEVSTTQEAGSRARTAYLLYSPTGDLNTRMPMASSGRSNPNFRMIAYNGNFTDGWGYDNNSTYERFTKKSTDFIVGEFRRHLPDANKGFLSWEAMNMSTDNPEYTPINTNTSPRTWSANHNVTVPSSGLSNYSYLLSTSSTATPDTRFNTTGTSITVPTSTIGGLKPVQYFSVKARDRNENWSEIRKFELKAPQVKATPSTTAWTNANVNMSVVATNGTYAINSVTRNGTSLATSAGTRTDAISSNGTYTYAVKDTNGFVWEDKVTVSNIDKTLPSGNLSASTTASTNGSVTLNLTGVSDSGGSGLRNIKLPNGAFVTGTSASYTVSANGTYTFTIYDNAGNVRTNSITVSNIDKTAPSGTLTQTPTGATNGNVTLNLKSIADTGGSGYYRTRLPNGNYVTTTTASQSVSANGTYSFIIYDKVGNSTTKSITVSNIDKTAPTGTLAQTPTATTGGNVTLNLTSIADTGGSGYYRTKLPNGTYATTTSASYTVTADGTYSFVIYDHAGNSTTKSIKVTNIDNVPPTANLAQTPTGWTKGNVTLNLTSIADSEAGMKNVTLPNGSIVTGTSASYLVSSNGTYTFTLTDNVGNSTTKSITVSNIDKTAPSGSVSQTPTSATNGNVTLNLTSVSDSGGSGLKNIKLPNGTFVTGTSASYSVSANGTYSFVIYDNAGNTTTRSITVSNIDKTAPSGNLSQTPTTWTKGNVTLKLTSVSDAGGSGLKNIKLPNGTFVTGTSASQVVTANGTYSFVIYDNAGNTTTRSITVSNIDKSVPVGSVVSNNTSPTNQPVTVTASGSDTASGLKLIELLNGTYSGRNLLLNSNREVTGRNEFVQFADISPIIDEHGLVPITISFDIKVAVPGSVRVYAQNGSTAKYSIGGTGIDATTSFVRHSVTVTPRVQDTSVSEAMLAFYGTYDTGRIVTVRNVKVELGSTETAYTRAPEDGEVVSGKKDFEFSDNGTYQFRFEDNAGNQTTKSLTISNIDKIDPTATLGTSTTAWTNQGVTLSLSSISDAGGAGIKSVKLPSGTVVSPVTATSYSQYVTANGTYSFVIEDKAGNSTTKSIKVSNIDKSSPNGAVSASTTAFTNQNVTLTLKSITESGGSGMKQVTLPNGTVISPVSATSYTHVVSSNGSYSFKLEDHAGNVTTKTLAVSNIDKSAPAGTLSASTTAWTKGSVTLSLKGITDSGVSGVRNTKLPNGSFVTGTSATYVVTGNGTYTFVIYDNAGNSTTRSITVSNIDTTVPVLNLSYNAPTNVITASVSDAGGSGLKEITRPDGTKVTGSSTTFSPSTFGDYSFTVSDNAGNTTTKSIFADRIISISDDAMRQALMDKIGQQFGITATVNHITESRLSQLTGNFDAKSKGIKNIQGIEYLKNISKVYLNGNPFSNVTPLQNLTQLHTLDISGTSVSDISSLNKLTNLAVLDVENSSISNLTALSSMSKLQVLTLSGTPVADLTPLTNLTNVTNLLANNTSITSLASLQKSTKMKVLHVENNALANLTGTSGMTQLTDLQAGQNQLTNISAIKNLTTLVTVDLNGNRLTTTADLTNLLNVTTLDISSNQLTSITGVTNMSKLAYLDMEANKVVSIAELGNKTLLKTFRANDNRIWDLTPLANKGTMTSFIISNNLVGKLPTNLNGFADSAYYNNFIPGKSGQNELRAISSQMMEEDAILDLNVPYTTIQNSWTSKVAPKVTISGNSGLTAENVKWNAFRLRTSSPSDGTGTVTYELNPDVKRSFKVTVLAVMPTVVVTPTNGTDWTNGTVTLDVKASNRVTDIQRIFLPNGTNVLASETQYVVSKNGIYGFAVLDGYGRMNYTYYEVRNIDTKAPSVKLIVPGDWTKTDPTIQVDVINE